MFTRPIATLGLAIAAACGSQPRVQHDPTTTDPTAEVVAVGGGLTPELITTVGSRPLMIEAFTPLRLSAKQRLRAQQLIADWATATGLKIVPPEQVELAIERAAGGLDPTTNQACGPALDREYATERWVVTPMGVEGSITARIDCEAACTMQLEIKLFALGTEFFAAPFDPGQPWDRELVRRLPTAVDNGGHDRNGHLNNPVAITGVPRKTGTSDWYREDNAFIDGLAVAEVAACGATDRRIGLLIDRADDGALSCEPASFYGYEHDTTINACACAAALKIEKPTTARTYVRYPEAPAPARGAETANGKRISAMLIGGNEYRPGGSAAWMLRESDSIAHCFVARTTEVAAAEIGATLEFDRTGRVAKATIGDLVGMLQPDERACITKKLMVITTPCPTATPLPGFVRVTLEIRAP